MSDELRRPGAANTSGTIREAIAPEHLGHARLSPSGAFEAGSFQTFELVYTAGKFGIDDSGALRVCFRFAADMSLPQLDRPEAPGFTTVQASNNAVLQVRFDVKGNVRPWDKTLWIKVVNGYLKAGDTITVTFGDRSGGSPGMRLQTFCEERFEFRVLVDPIATFNFQPLPQQPHVRIVPGAPTRYVLVLPTLRRTGERFLLRVKGEDRWGNPSDRCDVSFGLRASIPVADLPGWVEMAPGSLATAIDNLSAAVPGDLVIDLLDADGSVVSRSNPLRIVRDSPFVHYWGDLHGQSEETIGTGSARDYFIFARDLAFLDATCHQGNDFQMTQEFWEDLNALTAYLNQTGIFVCIPGYEWSGNTGMGGDRNVLFAEEGHRIRRSSHALIEDRSDLWSDCHTAGDLFEALAGAAEWDTVVMAHCGGRYADIALAHDGRFETSVEVHSAWGTFEWLVQDAFELGYRLGIVANSDGHKGRPGASYPGASSFGAIGGLTCFLTDELSRPAILDCLRRRRHYATTGGPGGRLVIDLGARFEAPGTRYATDPRLSEVSGDPVSEALMGDIVHLPAGEVDLVVDVVGAAGIERIDVFNGLELVETVRPFTEADLGRRIRVLFEGAAYRGRSRQVVWDGFATVAGNRIVDCAPINFFNPDKRLLRPNEHEVRWQALTTGNIVGFDLMLTERDTGTLVIKAGPVETDLEIGAIGLHDHVIDRSGPLPKLARIFRLPERNDAAQVRFERRVPLRATGDNPLFIRVAQEDGTRAWTSPIYVFRQG